jgi:Multiple antibiotic transporter
MLSSGNVTRSINTDEIAVVPLATPLLVGPGTMTALIVLTNQASTPLLDVLVGCGIATLIVYITFYFSEYIFKLLGQNGVKAISRLFTIILAAIAAQMIHSALLAWGLAKF